MKLTFYEGPMNMLEDAAMNALDATAEKLLGDVVDAQVIPFDVGTLQNEATYVDRSERSKGIERIVSNTPYARRLYFHPASKGEHPSIKSLTEGNFDGC